MVSFCVKGCVNGGAVWTVSNLMRGKPHPQWDLVHMAIPVLCDLVCQKDEEVTSSAW